MQRNAIDTEDIALPVMPQNKQYSFSKHTLRYPVEHEN